MDIVARMNDSFDALENKLLAIENVYSIMNEIPIPISADDKSSLKGLKIGVSDQKSLQRRGIKKRILPLKLKGTLCVALLHLPSFALE